MYSQQLSMHYLDTSTVFLFYTRTIVPYIARLHAFLHHHRMKIVTHHTDTKYYITHLWLDRRVTVKLLDELMDRWLGFYGISRTQIAAIYHA